MSTIQNIEDTFIDQIRDKDLIKMGSVIWKPEWVRPYESLWSIMNNLVSINYVKPGFLLSFFKRNDINENKYADYSNFITYQFKRNHFPFEFLPEYYLKSIEVFQIYDVISADYFFDNCIKVCPLCMKEGYHSYLHQLKRRQTCPFHKKEKLIEVREYKKDRNTDYFAMYKLAETAFMDLPLPCFRKEIQQIKKNVIEDIRYDELLICAQLYYSGNLKKNNCFNHIDLQKGKYKPFYKFKSGYLSEEEYMQFIDNVYFNILYKSYEDYPKYYTDHFDVKKMRRRFRLMYNPFDSGVCIAMHELISDIDIGYDSVYFNKDMVDTTIGIYLKYYFSMLAYGTSYLSASLGFKAVDCPSSSMFNSYGIENNLYLVNFQNLFIMPWYPIDNGDENFDICYHVYIIIKILVKTMWEKFYRWAIRYKYINKNIVSKMKIPVPDILIAHNKSTDEYEAFWI